MKLVAEFGGSRVRVDHLVADVGKDADHVSAVHLEQMSLT